MYLMSTNSVSVRVFDTYSAIFFVFVNQNVHQQKNVLLQPNNTINGQFDKCTCNCVFLSTCTGMFHTAAEYAACNYLLMCHSIRQSCVTPDGC